MVCMNTQFWLAGMCVLKAYNVQVVPISLINVLNEYAAHKHL